MQKLTKEQVKELWKNHKKEILIGGAALIGGTVACIIAGKRAAKQIKEHNEMGERIFNAFTKSNYTKMDIPKSVALMGISEISSPNLAEYADIWIDMASLRDLGDFGKALIDTYGWDPDSSISGVVSTSYVCGD